MECNSLIGDTVGSLGVQAEIAATPEQQERWLDAFSHAATWYPREKLTGKRR
jgi:hypothetical protein